jgi:hypothetical protein
MDPVEEYNEFVDDHIRLKINPNDMQCLIYSLDHLRAVWNPPTSCVSKGSSTDVAVISDKINASYNDYENLYSSYLMLLRATSEFAFVFKRILEYNKK